MPDMTPETLEEAVTEIDRKVKTWNDTGWDGRCVSCEGTAERVGPDDDVEMPQIVRAWAYGIGRKGSLIQNTFKHQKGCPVENALSEAARLAIKWDIELELGRVLHKVDVDGRATYLMVVRRKP
jgi:hypothetical protein